MTQKKRQRKYKKSIVPAPRGSIRGDDWDTSFSHGEMCGAGARRFARRTVGRYGKIKDSSLSLRMTGTKKSIRIVIKKIVKR